jgi:hypothetical protein
MSTTPKSPILGWEVKASRTKPENTYYFCKSLGKTQNEEPTEVCPGGASAPPATTSAPPPLDISAPPPAANTKKGINVTVQTPAGPKSFIVMAKGGKQRRTRKNKGRKNKSRNKKSRSRRA